MFTQLLVLSGIAMRLVAADSITAWLSDMCTNAEEFKRSPLPLGECIEFGQAQSYILDKDDGNVYNLYGGGACAQYVGQVSFSQGCLKVGPDATAIQNIGPQDSKRWIRGANAMGERVARSPRPKNGAALIPRVEGDTYQCPNIPSGTPYFFVVQSSSATHAETFPDEDTHIRNDFVAAFNGAYQNPMGQTQVTSFTPLGGMDIDDVQMTLDIDSGVIQDIQVQDIENLTNGFFNFRDAQSDPINFLHQPFDILIAAFWRFQPFWRF